MPRNRSEEKEQALVSTATRLFLERGVKATTIQTIAEQAGVAVGTVYTYFKDKKEMVRKVAFTFARSHHALAEKVLNSRRKPLTKLSDYVLGLFDMWQPFGENRAAAIELADAVFRWAPETPEMAQEEFQKTLEGILIQARDAGARIQRPAEEARWIAISTSPFFPLAGTPTRKPMSRQYRREDLEGLLQWIAGKLEG